MSPVFSTIKTPLLLAALVCLFGLALALAEQAIAAPKTSLIERYLRKVAPTDYFAGATAFGKRDANHPVVPVLKGEAIIGWVFLTSDFVPTNGYSGKPIHIIAGIDKDAIIQGVKLVKHSEPIVLIGIPDKRIVALTEGYTGLDLRKEAAAEGLAHDLDIISGATVTIMVIDDSIVRAGLKVARALSLGGLKPRAKPTGPIRTLKTSPSDARGWMELTGDRSVARLSLDIGQINDAFARSGNAEAAARPDKGEASDNFLDFYAALASAPTIGLSLLGPREHDNLLKDLKDGEQAILLAARGKYSYKGSGYVRGGIFDRIQLIQGDISVRFRDRDQRRLGEITAEGAPSFSEIDLFKIPAEYGFDPAKPWRIQLLVHRETGPIDKAFITFDLAYSLPERYVDVTERKPADTAVTAEDENSQAALWKRIWADRTVDVIVLASALLVLTAAFFFQLYITRSERFVFWFRIAFLTFTLVWIGWYANAQLSIVNVFAFSSALMAGFKWDTFLMDPMVFLLWFAVAGSLVFWGRGAFCGWLCPFGALQELTNRLAKLAKIPQWVVPWPLHERLWPIKYIIFLALFGLSLSSFELAEQYAEIEPFKTAIILKFARSWPFVVFALTLLGIGLFVERFYCRYLCPLGAALAIPARLRTFDWLKRYRECGSPCQRCAKECMVQAIHPEGNINPNECLYCLHCQVLYQHDQKCPVCIKRLSKRARLERQLGLAPSTKSATSPSQAAE